MSSESMEDKLLIQLLELQHGAINICDVKISADKVKWAKGYPQKKESFWNCEAFMWSQKIDSKKREVIRVELLKHININFESYKNLDLGSGSYCYIPSVAFDCSMKMLEFNDSALQKVEGDLQSKWPFDNSYFTSVTAVFVLNYIFDLDLVFCEVKRVLVDGGKFVAVISAKGVSELHQQHEKQKMDIFEWKKRFLKYFDSVEVYGKEDLWFFVCQSIDF